MIRVLYYMTNFERGGAQKFILEVIKAINSCKVQIDVVAAPKKSDLRDAYDDFLSAGATLYEAPHFDFGTAFWQQTWWMNFWRLHPQYSIFHACVDTGTFLRLRTAKVCRNIPTIAHVHHMHTGSGVKAKIRWALQNLSRRWADHLFACSDSAGSWLYGDSVLQHANYYMVPNGIDVTKFAYSPKRREHVRNLLGVGDAFVIGHVARLSPIKNQMFLLDVFSFLHTKFPNSKLLLVGDGELRPALEEKVRNLVLEGSVIFLGTQSEVADYYQAMDVFALPSLSEALPFTTVEAQCAGLPCVVSTGVPQVADMGAGLLQRRDLSDGVEAWGNNILGCMGKQRKDCSNDVREKGFDVSATAKWLENFYLRIGNDANL